MISAAQNFVQFEESLGVKMRKEGKNGIFLLNCDGTKY